MVEGFAVNPDGQVAVEVIVTVYDERHGLVGVWTETGRLRASPAAGVGDAVIEGDRDGLRALAVELLVVASYPHCSGSTYLDAESLLEPGSADIRVAKASIGDPEPLQLTGPMTRDSVGRDARLVIVTVSRFEGGLNVVPPMPSSLIVTMRRGVLDIAGAAVGLTEFGKTILGVAEASADSRVEARTRVPNGPTIRIIRW